jgi:hypothetical protein
MGLHEYRRKPRVAFHAMCWKSSRRDLAPRLCWKVSRRVAWMIANPASPLLAMQKIPVP